MFPCVLQLMAAYTFLLFLLFTTSIFFNTQASRPDCSAAKCSHDSPIIHFPFRLKDQQPQHCGLSGFELFCKENTTMIHLPSYGDLVVKCISYDIKKLDLLDPRNCVPEVFLNLNVSLSSFQYYYVVKDYKYLNCSAKLPNPSTEIPCLSGSKHHVYCVEASEKVPFSCREVKTVAIPFAYSPYISDNSFGLGLTWNLSPESCGQVCTAFTTLIRFLSKWFSKMVN